MSVYRNILSSFWTDPKVRRLCPKGKLLFLYLITNPHAHVSGIYYLTSPLVCQETGLSGRELDTLWDTTSGAGLVKIDRNLDIVWVRKMFFYQARGEKACRAAANHLAELHKSSLIKDFLAFYPEVKQYVKDGVWDTPSMGVPGQDQFGIQDQDQDQDKDKEEGCGEPEYGLPADLPPEEIVLTFPCSGKKTDPREWHLGKAKLAEYAESFPGVDALAECRKALQWCRDNPSKRKTARGMTAFLSRWLSSAQDRGGFTNGQAANGQARGSVGSPARISTDEAKIRAIEARTFRGLPPEAPGPGSEDSAAAGQESGPDAGAGNPGDGFFGLG
jgi:hypothetical protein